VREGSQQLFYHRIFLVDSAHLALQHKVIGFYNRDGKCLQRGMDWGFK
jgi:hypothetical protein